METAAPVDYSAETTNLVSTPESNLRDEHSNAIRRSSSSPRPQSRGEHETSDSSQSPQNASMAAVAEETQEEKNQLLPSKAKTKLSSAKESISRFWKRLSTPIHRLLKNSWWGEFLLLIFILGCFAAIVSVFSNYNGRALSSWGLGITLNTLLQILLTPSRSAIAYLVSQGFGQQKWVWFTGKLRPAEDINKYDGAARGAYGASKFMNPFGRYGLTAFLGALLTTLLLTVASFSQESIQYVDREVKVPGVFASYSPRCTNFSSWDPITNGPATTGAEPDVLTLVAIYNGILAGTRQPVEHSTPFCSTGNCTFPPYHSLGVCASTMDLTPLLKTVCVDGGGGGDLCTSSIPGGPKFYDDFSGTKYGLIAAGNADSYAISKSDVPSYAFKNQLNNSLVDFYAIWRGWKSQTNHDLVHRAVEINLQYCVQTFETHVNNGISQTKLIGVHKDFKAVPTKAFKHNQCVTQTDWTATIPGSSDKFVVDCFSQQALRYRLSKIFTAQFVISPDGTYSSENKVALKGFLNAIDSPPYNVEALGVMAENLAISLSNNFRSYQGRKVAAMGQAFRNETYIHIRWEFLIMLEMVIGGTIMFLGLVLYQSLKAHVLPWKTSSLALARSVDVHERPEEFVGLKDNFSMEKHSEGVQFQLQKDGELWKLKA